MRDCILASASPRRKEILKNLGVRVEVFATDVDERTDKSDPCDVVEELSVRKGRAAAEMLWELGRKSGGRLIVASDTVVEIDGKLLGKPQNAADATRMLRLLSGRKHRVISGIYLALGGQEAVSHAVTEVEFAPMDDEDIAAYIRTEEPFGKAGAYAIQGIGAMWVRGIRGDYFNVVGLPVNRMCELFFEKFGEKFL